MCFVQTTRPHSLQQLLLTRELFLQQLPGSLQNMLGGQAVLLL